MVFLVALFLSACAKSPPKTVHLNVGERTPKAIALEKSIQDFTQETKFIKALAWMEIGDGEEERRTDAAVVIERPSSARVDAFDQLADVWAKAGTDGKKLWLYIPAKSKLYSGRASKSNLHRLAKFDWELTELISVLSGSPPIVGEMKILQTGEKKEGHFIVGDSDLHIWADKKSDRILRSARYSADGQIDFTVDFTNWKKTSGVDFPYRIEATFPERGAKIMVVYRDVVLGKEIDPEMFVSPDSHGAKTVELKDGNGEK